MEMLNCVFCQGQRANRQKPNNENNSTDTCMYKAGSAFSFSLLPAIYLFDSVIILPKTQICFRHKGKLLWHAWHIKWVKCHAFVMGGEGTFRFCFQHWSLMHLKDHIFFLFLRVFVLCSHAHAQVSQPSIIIQSFEKIGET